MDGNIGAQLLMNNRHAMSAMSSRSGSVIDIASVKSARYNDDDSLESVSVVADRKATAAAAAMSHGPMSDAYSRSESRSRSHSHKSRSHRGQRNSSRYSDVTGSVISATETDSTISMSTVAGNKRLSQEDIVNMKRELLYQFDRFERKGIKMPRKFTMSSSLEEMKAEYDRVKMDRSLESSIRWQRDVLNMVTSGVEWASKQWNPWNIKLKGYNDKIMERAEDFDEIFEDLHYKYQGKTKFPPELKLFFLLISSAVTLHISNTLLGHIPGMDEVMRQNPQLREQVASATLRTMANDSTRQQTDSNGSGGMPGIMSMLGPMMSMFMGGGASSSPPPHPSTPAANTPPPTTSRQMRGPSDINEILKQMKQPPLPTRMDDVSTVSGSDISDIPEDASVSGIFVNNKGKKGAQNTKRTLNI